MIKLLICLIGCSFVSVSVFVAICCVIACSKRERAIQELIGDKTTFINKRKWCRVNVEV